MLAVGKSAEGLHLAQGPYPVVLDKLLHIVLSQVIGLDVCFNKLFVRNGPQVCELLQLHEELLKVQLHKGTALITAFLHISIATEGHRTQRRFYGQVGRL